MKLSDTDCDERNEDKSQSIVKPKETNKNSDKIETPQNKTKIHHRGRGKRQNRQSKYAKLALKSKQNKKKKEKTK